MNKLLVIIVTYNGSKWIRKCLKNLYSSTCSFDCMIVDNASTDETTNIIENEFSQVILIRQQQNLGFGKANNIGLSYALKNDYDFVFLLNQDAYLQPNTIEILINMQIKYPQYGILSPMQMSGEEKKLDYSFRSLLQYQTPDFLDDLFIHNLQEVYTSGLIPAAMWLISKECLQKVGGFDPLFAHYGEDNNYIHRIWYYNFKSGIVPTAIGFHDREQNTTNKKLYLRNHFFNVFLVIALNINYKLSKALLLSYFNLFKSVFFKCSTWRYIFKSFIVLSKVLNHRIQYKTQQALFI